MTFAKIRVSFGKKVLFFLKEMNGLVLAESASYIAGATINEQSSGYTKADFVMHGSIHMQMRNDKNLKVKLEKLYNGDYGGKFRLKP